MRCLLFTDTVNDVNGVARFVRTLAAWASRSGHELRVVSSSAKPSGEHHQKLENVQILRPVVRMRMPRYQDLDLAIPPAPALLRVAREFNPDVIHVSTPGPVGVSGVLIALRLGVPLVGTWHTSFPEYVARLTGIKKLGDLTYEGLAVFYRKFDCVLARSPASLPELRELGARNVRAFKPGVDLERFSPAHRDREIWREWGMEPERLKVLSVGRVSVEKNMPLLVEACGDLREADFVVVGDGPYRERMQEGMPRAKFLSFQHGDMLSKLYASSDLVVFPSTTDTLGQVVLEAQASGVPVMVSDEGGPRCVVDHGRTGVVMQDLQPRHWGEMVHALLADRQHLAEMGAHARQWMEQFSIDASCEDFWRCHVQLLDQLRARRA